MSVPLQIRTRNKLLVGLDYGTTYSGLCFALSNAADFNDIRPWCKWPGGPTENNEYLQKAPSRVAYASENSDLDQDAWGYEIEPGMTTYSWTKLLLDGSAVATEYDDPNLKKAAANGLMKLPPGKQAVDVVTDYMKGMYQMFNQAVKDIGLLSDDEATLSMPVEFWLTVPATWSEEARWATRSAALRAGFATRPGDEINLIPEPEAATHLALKDGLHHVNDLIKEGTGVLVCDCGGGTVDITTYTIDQIVPRLKLAEACVGIGGKCGGTFIDRNLYQLLTQRYGTAFTSLPPEHTGPGSRFMQAFESKKRAFSGIQVGRRGHKLPLNMPDALASASGYDKRWNDIVLSHDDMKKCFDPVVEKIIELVSSQVSAVTRAGNPRVETIILVGGLGESPYVREKLSEWVQSRNIRLTTPMGGGWSAIVRGAVLRGLEGSIVDIKKCRRHYGHTLSKEYEPSIHYNFDENKRHLWKNTFDKNKQMLSGFMYWEMEKGAEIDETTEILSEFVCHYTEGNPMVLEHKLYSCSLDAAPDSIENERVECVGVLKASFADLDLSKLQSTDSEDHKVYRISFTLGINLGAKDGTLNVRLLMRGREIGKATIDFSYR
ncbi:hsp70-like protein [Amniculicola lignicola CBS 123094]|uniref:Hsp70-like protein n=1 Tax=Amniculicola lignicola CBS 123094 TaxID=1392246 RepID=A0A6A5W4Q6_9PLEO|nr:hsp70-like protein [Amniculicola lignicola CBS 123094]